MCRAHTPRSSLGDTDRCVCVCVLNQAPWWRSRSTAAFLLLVHIAPVVSQSCIAGGVPGIPGTHGPNGSNGPKGPRGDPGERATGAHLL